MRAGLSAGMKNFLLVSIGVLCIGLGLLGLVVPIIPGVIFLALAVVIFAGLSPRLRARLTANPRFRRLFARIDAGAHLHPFDRIKLTRWACLEAVTRTRRI